MADPGADADADNQFRIFNLYLDIALSDGTEGESMNQILQKLIPRFSAELTNYVASLRDASLPIPDAAMDSITAIYDRAKALWAPGGAISEHCRLNMEQVELHMFADVESVDE